jgi:hypothetical protein
VYMSSPRLLARGHNPTIFHRRFGYGRVLHVLIARYALSRRRQREYDGVCVYLNSTRNGALLQRNLGFGLI